MLPQMMIKVDEEIHGANFPHDSPVHRHGLVDMRSEKPAVYNLMYFFLYTHIYEYTYILIMFSDKKTLFPKSGLCNSESTCVNFIMTFRRITFPVLMTTDSHFCAASVPFSHFLIWGDLNAGKNIYCLCDIKYKMCFKTTFSVMLLEI